MQLVGPSQLGEADGLFYLTKVPVDDGVHTTRQPVRYASRQDSSDWVADGTEARRRHRFWNGVSSQHGPTLLASRLEDSKHSGKYKLFDSNSLLLFYSFIRSSFLSLSFLDSVLHSFFPAGVIESQRDCDGKDHGLWRDTSLCGETQGTRRTIESLLARPRSHERPALLFLDGHLLLRDHPLGASREATSLLRIPHRSTVRLSARERNYRRTQTHLRTQVGCIPRSSTASPTPRIHHIGGRVLVRGPRRSARLQRDFESDIQDQNQDRLHQ